MSLPFLPIKPTFLVWQNNLPFCAATFAPLYSINAMTIAEQYLINGNQLISRWQTLFDAEDKAFVIAETHFGGGLHFLLTWMLWLRHAPKNARLYYLAAENHPLTANSLEQLLALWPLLEREGLLFLKAYPLLTPGFHQLIFDEGRVNLTLMLGETPDCFNQLLVCGEVDLEKSLRPYFVDAWYFHSMESTRHSTPLHQSLSLLSKVGTTLASTESLNAAQSTLTAAGFVVKGMTAYCNKSTEQCFNNKSTPWHSPPRRIVNKKKAIILGAGLAGCFAAYSLAKRGWHITLVDELSKVGMGASGVPQAIVYPTLSGFNSPLSAFMLSAYLYANRTYCQMLESHSIGKMTGLLQLAYNDKEGCSQARLQSWLAAYPALGKRVNADEASELTGVLLQTGGLYLPLSGWINCHALCHVLASHPGITWIPDHAVEALHYEQGNWSTGSGHQAEVLILATGFKTNLFSQTARLPLRAMFGQLSLMPSNSQSEQLKIPICAEGHLLPAYNQQHLFGATYYQGLMTPDSELDNQLNLARLSLLTTPSIFNTEVNAHWQGIRAATPDYLPLVGPVPNAVNLLEIFSPLASDSKRWLPQAGDYYPGLFLCTGLGSRGLTTAPLSGELLASLINNEPSPLPRRLVQALSPARFLIKKISRKI